MKWWASGEGCWIRRLVGFLLLLAVFAAPAEAVVKPPAAEPTARGKGGAAASVDPYATKAAISVLRRGGTAVDAAVAAAAVLGVVEPFSSGIGGGGFMVVKTPRGGLKTFDGREFAPAAFTETSLQENGAAIDFDEAVTSGLGVGVPGTPATWELALRRFGSMPLSRALKPATRLARKGFVVDETLQAQTEDNAERFIDFPATARLYLPGGQPIQAGATLRNPDLADTMALMAKRGVDQGFYRRAVAKDIVATVRKPPVREGATRTVRPGLMKVADLRAYRALRRKAATTSYRGMRVAGMGPPSSGGTTVGESLNIIEAFGEPAADSSETLYRYLEATRLAYADRSAYLGDPAFTDVPVGCLLSQPFADARQRLIGETAAMSPVAAGECPMAEASTASESREGPSTTHLTVADRRGFVVSYTFTIEQTGGSAITVPGRGFLLNNELTDFSFDPGTPNSPAARKRPRSSMSPTIVLRDGEPVLALGSPGGSTIITTVLQILLNRYERGLSLPAALAAPRASQRNSPTTDAEPAFITSPEAAGLIARGQMFTEIEGGELGAAAAVEIRDGGRFVASAEPERRGGGSAMVVRPAKRPGR
ncbi:MAG: gamma-glutamyltransferase [Solirubrobacteraceae bacterium]